MSFTEYFRDKWEDFSEYLLIEHDIDVSLVSLYIPDDMGVFTHNYDNIRVL